MKLSSEKARQATRVVQTLRDRGYSAYLAGGCVRDVLLGREPSDYDVATSATPEQVMLLFPRTYAVGAQFGVVLLPIQREAEAGEENDSIEIATFRSDGHYSDGRHPDQVQFSSDARLDVQRRDFTINGLLLDPLTGEVLDYVEGRRELQTAMIPQNGDPQRL